MSTRWANDYAGTVGNITDPDELDADTIVGVPAYVAVAGHTPSTTSVEFGPGEYVKYPRGDYTELEYQRIWVKTPASSDSVGEDWLFLSWRDGAGAELISAAINPNGKWKLRKAGSSPVTSSGSVTWDTLYGVTYYYDIEGGTVYLSSHDATTDDVLQEVFSANIPGVIPSELWIGNVLASDSALWLSDGTQASDELTIGDPPPVTDGLAGNRPGNGTESSFDLVTYTGNATSVRVRYRDTVSGVEIGQTTPQTPTARGHARHTIASLNPFTKHDYLPQRLVAGVWTDMGSWTGPIRTHPVPGQAVNFRLAGAACAHQWTNQDAGINHLLSREPDVLLYGGDQNYKNKTQLALQPYFDAWEGAWNSTTGLRRLFGKVLTYLEVSDHDSAEGGNSGAGAAGTPYMQEAVKQMFPFPPLASPNTLAQVIRYGRHTMIMPDFRSQYRTEHDAPLDSRTAYGAPQLAAIIAAIHEAGARRDLIWFVSDAVFLGTEEGMTGGPQLPKKDCLPNYAADRQAIVDALIPYQHLILDFDFHCLRYVRENALTGGPLFGGAGIITTFGNYRGDGVYDETYGTDLDDPALGGTRGRVFFDYDITQVDNIVTLEAHGWSVTSGGVATEVISPDPIVFDLDTVIVPPPPPPIPQDWVIDGVNMSNLARRVAESDPHSGVSVGEGLRIPYRIGRITPRILLPDENEIVLHMWARGADENGNMPPGDEAKAVCRAELDMISRIWAGPGSREVRKRFGDEWRVIFGQVVEAVNYSTNDGRLAMFSVRLRCAYPFWRDLEPTSQTVDFNPDGTFKAVLPFTLFAGTTAPVQDYRLELFGQMKNPQIAETIGPPTAFTYDGIIQSNKRLTITTAPGVLTAIKDTPADPGDPVDDEIESMIIPHGTLPILYPRSDGSYALTVSTTDAPGINAEVRLTAYRWYALRG